MSSIPRFCYVLATFRSIIPVLVLSSTKSAPQKIQSDCRQVAVLRAVGTRTVCPDRVGLPTGRRSPGCGYEDRLPGQGRLADRSLYPLPGERKSQRQTVRRTEEPRAECSENRGRLFCRGELSGYDDSSHIDLLAARTLQVILRRPVGRDRRLDRSRKAVDGGIRRRIRGLAQAKKLTADNASVLLPISCRKFLHKSIIGRTVRLDGRIGGRMDETCHDSHAAHRAANLTKPPETTAETGAQRSQHRLINPISLTDQISKREYNRLTAVESLIENALGTLSPLHRVEINRYGQHLKNYLLTKIANTYDFCYICVLWILKQHLNTAKKDQSSS